VLRRIKVIRKESELKQKITETEMAALRAQMNPHFIFNCINAIDNLIQTGEKDDATTYLAMFARLIRNVLESSKNNIIPFQKDLESIKLYIKLEQLRCSNKFRYTIDTDADLLNGDYKVPPLIIQPFIENAIHHGLLNKESGTGELKISIFLKEDFINYMIVDNGVGRERAAALTGINKPEHLSYGIAISTERLERYNEDFDSIQITDLYDKSMPVGTKVEINIKTDESKSTT
jgi:LytS/YehU family sensor histidine kinase